MCRDRCEHRASRRQIPRNIHTDPPCTTVQDRRQRTKREEIPRQIPPPDALGRLLGGEGFTAIDLRGQLLHTLAAGNRDGGLAAALVCLSRRVARGFDGECRVACLPFQRVVGNRHRLDLVERDGTAVSLEQPALVAEFRRRPREAEPPVVDDRRRRADEPRKDDQPDKPDRADEQQDGHGVRLWDHRRDERHGPGEQRKEQTGHTRVEGEDTGEREFRGCDLEEQFVVLCA